MKILSKEAKFSASQKCTATGRNTISSTPILPCHSQTSLFEAPRGGAAFLLRLKGSLKDS